MAETNSSLGFDSKLQIVIVPKDKKYDTSTKNTHILVFREGTNIIEVNGHEYQAAKTGDLSKITEALKNTGYLTEESNGVLTAKAPGTVADLLGTKISTTASGDKKTVSAWIDDILGKISLIDSNISNLKNLTNTEGAGAFVVRDNSGGGKTDFANTKAIHTAIDNAKKAAIDAAATDATNKDNQVKKALIGNGTDSPSDDSTPLKPGSGNTWAKSEAQQKNLSHLKDLLVDLQGQLDTLSGTNLKEVKDTIAAIKQELINGEGSGLTTIIDSLKVFLGSGLTTGGPSYTVNSETYTKLQEIITALETEIKARIASVSKRSGETYIDVTTDSNKNVIVSSSEDLKTAVTNANSAIQSVNKGSNDSLILVSTSNKAVTVSSSPALQTAVTNANSAIQSVNTSEETLISVSTSNKAVTVSSTPELKTAVTNANAAFPKGESSYKDAAALESGLKGNLSSDKADAATIAGAKKYADSKSAAAQSNAEAKALLYANNVITWTVIS